MHWSFCKSALKGERFKWITALLLAVPPGQQPRRAVIVRFHHFQDKVRIMQAARKERALTYNRAPNMLFEEFSAAVMRKRQEFYQVKQQLKENPKEAVIFQETVRQQSGSPSAD